MQIHSIHDAITRPDAPDALFTLVRGDPAILADVRRAAAGSPAARDKFVRALIDRYEQTGALEDLTHALAAAEAFRTEGAPKAPRRRAGGRCARGAHETNRRFDPGPIADGLRRALLVPQPRPQSRARSIIVLERFDRDLAAESVADRLAKFAPLAAPLPLVPAPDPDQFYAAFTRLAPNLTALADVAAEHFRLSWRYGDGRLKLPTIILVGPPGSGKSWTAQLLFRAAKAPYQVLNAGGGSDARFLIGTSRGYGTAEPSAPARLMLSSRCANPGIIVDEIDKAANNDYNGRVQDALLGMTEPSTARGWLDEFLAAPLDLSHVSWVMTANQLAAVPAPLQSRAVVISVNPPTADQLDAVMDGMSAEAVAGLGADHPNEARLTAAEKALVRDTIGDGAIDLRRVRRAVTKLLAAREPPVVQ